MIQKIYKWTLCAAATVVTCGRVWIRLQRFKALKADDFFNILASASLIGFAVMAHLLNYTSDVSLGYKYDVAQNLLLWTTLYFVKASFLALIRAVFKVSKNFDKGWWAVAIYTSLSFWPVSLSELWTCGDPSKIGNVDACDSISLEDAYLRDPVWMRFFLHVSSECFILILPLTQIKKMHVSRVKKISVAAVFAIIIIDIIIGIIRNSAAICLSTVTENEICSEMNGNLSVAEPSIAVMVCALPAYRALLPSSGARKDRTSPIRRNEATMGLGSPQKFTPLTLSGVTTEATTDSEVGPMF
ncbi:hypothetical protein MMC10_000655 [Thelotrema lepadinum]|nr:hypothetical protein [Thelotrema lepadinum]